MSEQNESATKRAARERYLLFQRTRGNTIPVLATTAPVSLEATLATISADVTAEAIERREQADRLVVKE